VDLATRVPATRPTVVEQMGKILQMRQYRDATRLLLAGLYIIVEYSESSDPLVIILTPNILFCSERVQVSTLSTAFKFYVRCPSNEEFETAEALIQDHLREFETGLYSEIQDIAVMTLSLIDALKAEPDGVAFQSLKERLLQEYDEENFEELDVPRN
jgi:hypothetical protein